MRRSLLAASLTCALIVVVLSPLVQANQDDDLFTAALAWYDDNTKQQCDLSDCQCLLEQAKLASEVAAYAKGAMATHILSMIVIRGRFAFLDKRHYLFVGSWANQITAGRQWSRFVPRQEPANKVAIVSSFWMAGAAPTLPVRLRKVNRVVQSPGDFIILFTQSSLFVIKTGNR